MQALTALSKLFFYCQTVILERSKTWRQRKQHALNQCWQCQLEKAAESGSKSQHQGWQSSSCRRIWLWLKTPEFQNGCPKWKHGRFNLRFAPPVENFEPHPTRSKAPGFQFPCVRFPASSSCSWSSLRRFCSLGNQPPQVQNVQVMLTPDFLFKYSETGAINRG